MSNSPDNGRMMRSARDGAAAQLEAELVDCCRRCLSNIMELANGVLVEKSDGEGDRKVFERPPDRSANEYVLNRVLGRPPSRRQVEDPVVPEPKLDLSHVPLDRLRTMESWLKEAGVIVERSNGAASSESTAGDRGQ